MTGGFDTHDGLLEGQHQALLSGLNNALKFFWDALGNLNMRDWVTTHTASDFGRTYASNGNGSDHADGAPTTSSWAAVRWPAVSYTARIQTSTAIRTRSRGGSGSPLRRRDGCAPRWWRRGPFGEFGPWHVRQRSRAGLIRSALFAVPWTSWQLKQVTPRVYITLCTKSLPCIRFLCAVPSAKVRERRLAELVLFELPEVLQVRALVKADRPVVVLPFDRIRQRLSLRVALDAGVVGAHVVEPRGIDDVGAAGLAHVLAAGAVALLAADVPLGDGSWSGCCSSPNGSRRRADRSAACMLSAG